MPGYGSFTMLDASREKGTFSFYTGNVTAVSLPGLLTEFGALRTAIEGVTLGVVAKESLKVFDTTLSNTPPADEMARVETAWYVQYQDNLPFFDDPVNAIPNAGYGKLFGFTIPTADIEGRMQAGTDFADLTDPGIEALVTALETTLRSPYGGTIKVVSIEAVGRNR